MHAIQAGIVPDKPTVLLVEDEVLIRLMVADELRSQGIQVLEASDAEEAMTVLKSELAVHMLFTDIRMPGRMDGMALARFTREHYPHIKLVVASSQLSAEAVQGLADEFIPKPFDLPRTITKIERLLAEVGNER
jgi:DNA-binding NtrC family response regulator